MKKIEYEQRRLDIEASIKALKEELKQLQDEYISHHKVFADFEKIEVITREHPYWTSNSGKEPAGIKPETRRHAFVVGYEIDWRNNVVPKLKKCKKDGTISNIRDSFDPRIDIIKSVI